MNDMSSVCEHCGRETCDCSHRSVAATSQERTEIVSNMMKYMNQKFKLGHVVFTPGAIEVFENAGGDLNDAGEFLLRHACGDWGALDDEDKQENDKAVAHENEPEGEKYRVMSVYLLADGTKIWIITEWNRSTTTVLLPEEY